MLCPLNRRSSDFAIIDRTNSYSYQDCDALCFGIVKDLKKQGVKPGSVVAFIAHPTVPVILTLFALMRLGAIACPLSARLPSIDKETQQIRATHVITPKLSATATGSAELDILRPATYLFTSGSSSAPKVAIHNLSNHIYSALGVNSRLGFSSQDSWQLSLPLWHVGGLAILFRAFLAGGAVALKAPASHASWVPTQLMRALDEDVKYKKILIGGAQLSIQQALKASHLPIIPSYGLTEMSSTVLIQNQVLPYRRVKIENGELHVSGATLFQGYLDEEPQSGWFATGDLVRSDLSIVGRKDRLFISGGENIQPEEIEQALLKLPGIEIACVVAVPDPEFGERPVAFVDRPHGCKDQLADLLPKFKHPIRYFPLPKMSGKPSLPALALRAQALMQG